MKTRIYERSVHTFYDDLSTFLCNTASLGIAIDAIKRGSYGGFAGNPQHYFEFEGCKVPKVFTWRPHASLLLVSNDQWPSKIELAEDASVHVSGGPRIGSLKGIVAMSLGAAFVRYFESRHSEICARYGEQPYLWPGELNFARVIRNAFAHGGQISFQNPNAGAVAWMGISYSPADNGREIVFRDIGLVEPILLMEEIDSRTR
jgi:hypothetical protein